MPRAYIPPPEPIIQATHDVRAPTTIEQAFFDHHIDVLHLLLRLANIDGSPSCRQLCELFETYMRNSCEEQSAPVRYRRARSVFRCWWIYVQETDERYTRTFPRILLKESLSNLLGDDTMIRPIKNIGPARVTTRELASVLQKLADLRPTTEEQSTQFFIINYRLLLYSF